MPNKYLLNCECSEIVYPRVWVRLIHRCVEVRTPAETTKHSQVGLTESLGFTEETRNTVKQLYSNKKLI